MFQLSDQHVAAFDKVAATVLVQHCHAALQEHTSEFYESLSEGAGAFVDQQIFNAKSFQLIYQQEIIEYVTLTAQFSEMREQPLAPSLIKILTYPNRDGQRKFLYLRAALELSGGEK